MEANSPNSLPNSSAEEKTTRNSVLCGKKIEANSRNSVPNHYAEEKTTQSRMYRGRQSDQRGCASFVKLYFFAEFLSFLFRASELALPRNSECLGMSTFFRGITETVPSLFRGIFSDEIPFPTLYLVGLLERSVQLAGGAVAKDAGRQCRHPCLKRTATINS
jgi:hypothetical protein